MPDEEQRDLHQPRWPGRTAKSERRRPRPLGGRVRQPGNHTPHPAVLTRSLHLFQ